MRGQVWSKGLGLRKELDILEEQLPGQVYIPFPPPSRWHRQDRSCFTLVFIHFTLGYILTKDRARANDALSVI